MVFVTLCLMNDFQSYNQFPQMKSLKISLLYRYLDDNETFLNSTSSDLLQLQCTELNHSHSHCIPFVGRKYYPDSFFLRMDTLWNRLSNGSFLDIYNLNHFLSRDSRQLPSKSYLITVWILNFSIKEQQWNITLRFS